MNAAMPDSAGRLFLREGTAADLMSPDPATLHADAPLSEALAFFVDRNLSGAAVVDDDGRPVGVLSQSDLLIHARERVEPPNTPGKAELSPTKSNSGDATRVREVMTPAVFCVRSDAPVLEVVGQLRGMAVHRLFVTDGRGVLVGVVTAMDVVRRLESEGPGDEVPG